MDRLERLKQAELDDEKAAAADELIYKKSYYKNINSIRKNIQFFFWMTVIPAIIYIIFFLLTI